MVPDHLNCAFKPTLKESFSKALIKCTFDEAYRGVILIRY